MRGLVTLVALVALAAAEAAVVAPAQPPPNRTKMFEYRISIVGKYRFSANASVRYQGCTVVFQGSGGGDANLTGRGMFYYQRFSTPEGERIWRRLPKPRATVSLNRFGSLQATTTCPPPDARSGVQQGPTKGCRRVTRRVVFESGFSGSYRRPLSLILNAPSSDIGEIFYRSEPCPPTRGPYGIGLTSSMFPWGGFVDEGNPRLRIREATLLRSRFIRRTWSFEDNAPLVAPDVGRARIGTQERVWQMRVLFCAKSAGGCGNRKP